MRYASTFLSHAHEDGGLVRAVAKELGRRGVLPWLDINELVPGQRLSAALREAIAQQTTATFFLSASSLKSKWFEEELAVALELRRDHPELRDWILPVFLGNPAVLVEAQPLLADWLRPDGRVDVMGIVAQPPSAANISEQLVRAIFQRLGLRTATEMAIVLDQRGAGARTGKPTVADEATALDVPALVFRPDMENRTYYDVIDGSIWKSFADTVCTALTVRHGQRVHLLGDSQLALPFRVGQHLDRTTGIHLTTWHRSGQRFAVDYSDHVSPLAGGNPYCTQPSPGCRELATGESCPHVALLLMPEHLVVDAAAHAATRPEPAVVVHTRSRYDKIEQVLGLVADLTALLQRLKAEHETRQFSLYTGLPFHVLPIVAGFLRNTSTLVEMREFRPQTRPVDEKYVGLELTSL